MTDVKVSVQNAQKSKLDGAANISKDEYTKIKNDFQKSSQSTKSVEWLKKNNPALHTAITSDLNYEGYTGTYIGALNSTREGGELKQDAAQRGAKKKANLPAIHQYREDGLHRSEKHPDPIDGTTKGMQTGKNYTKLIDGNAPTSEAEAKKSRQAQTDYTTKMSGVTGLDLTNPPSVKAARTYFKTLAANGASQKHIQKEFQDYQKTFYKHAGGVNWNGTAEKGGKLDPKKLDESFKDQPIAVDGKRLIDCEGYAAMTENILGDLKQKNGKKMFDIKHGQSPEHVVTGVFPHGGDPRDGFVVDNDNSRNLREIPISEKDWRATPNPEARKNWLLRTHLKQEHPDIQGNYKYGDTLPQMEPGEDMSTRDKKMDPIADLALSSFSEHAGGYTLDAPAKLEVTEALRSRTGPALRESVLALVSLAHYCDGKGAGPAPASH